MVRRVTEKEVEAMGRKACGFVHYIYLHWTAGHYNGVFEDYHLNITGNGSIYASTEDFTEILSHTWHRNSCAIGIALCCASDAMLFADGSFDLGSEPPTQAQIEAAARVLAVLGKALNIPLDERHVKTHAEAADLDGYGPKLRGTPRFEKWDLWKLPDYDGTWRSGGAVLRGKGSYYQNKLKH